MIMSKNELYFNTNLTESEHDIVEMLLERQCAARGLELKYYRKLKTGHVPCVREAKVIGPVYKAKEMIKDLDLYTYNYWVKEREEMEEMLLRRQEKQKI